jgi:transcriptional regulator with XRE-family HTH domain
MTHTDGRRQLLAVAQRDSQAAIAARVGVTEACVSWWCSGRSRPARRARKLLHEAYGIRPESWGELHPKWARRET